MSNIKNIAANYYTSNNERFVFIDGNSCDTLDKCYNTLQQQLSIPDYFGHNLDALEEVLADVEWVAEEKIHIIILSKTDLLKNDIEKKQSFLDVINSNDNKKISITILGSS
jgi:RNAse (barnase) inhibitor barstar